MIYVVTVHHLTDKWLKPQIERLDLYVRQPFEVHASVNFDVPLFVVCRGDVHTYWTNPRREGKNSHRPKLMQVTKQVLKMACDGDTLLFLDGDAFPVASIDGLLDDLLTTKFIGVKRTEKGEPLPHPCFALANVGFWRRFNGTWRNGKLRSERFWRRVRDARTPVKYLERTAGTSLHPVFFSVYGDVVYHHGAGFRVPVLLSDARHMTGSEREAEIDRLRGVSDKVYENIVGGRGFWHGLEA